MLNVSCGFKELLKKYFKNNTLRNETILRTDVYYFVDDYAAVRKTIDESFKSIKWIRENVTDTGIQKILINHLKKYNEIDGEGRVKEHPELAFSDAGISDMNDNILELNGGKQHQPIYKVRVYETLGNKFAVGIHGNKASKYVEAAKGTNLYFAIYSGINKKGEQTRIYDTVPLNVVIERQKQRLSPVPDMFLNEKSALEAHLLFYLSPNDFVYVPSDEEIQNINSVSFNNLTKEQNNRIYRMEKASGKECYFIQSNVATLIMQYDSKKRIGEFGSQNKLQTTIEGQKIVERCIKLKINRLGKIEKA